MKKFLLGTVAAAAILGSSAVAFAGVYVPSYTYYYTCGWVPVIGGWAYVCN